MGTFPHFYLKVCDMIDCAEKRTSQSEWNEIVKVRKVDIFYLKFFKVTETKS